MDSGELDFSIVDTDLERSPNDITGSSDDLGDDKDYETNLYVPQSSADASPVPRQSGKIDIEDVKSLLSIACETSGVTMTEHMVTTVIALSHSIGLEPRSLDWFIAGVVYANNSMIIEKMTSAIKDLQSEIRGLQNVSSSISTVSTEFLGKMAYNKKEILDDMDKTRESVLEAAREIKHMVIVGDKEEFADMSLAKGSSDDSALPPPKAVDPILQTPTINQSIASVNAEELLRRRKRKCLMNIGFTESDIRDIGEENVTLIMTDEEMIHCESGLSTDEANMVFDEIMDRVIEFEFM